MRSTHRLSAFMPLGLVLIGGLLLLGAAVAGASPPGQADPAPVLAAARADLESLANDALGSGGRPPGWTGTIDTATASFVVDLRLDLETLAGNLLAPDQRPPGWFGVVRSTGWAVARDVRHDLELLADTVLSGGRPAVWVGGEPLMRCERALQSTVAWLQRTNSAYTLTANATGLAFCDQASQEANTFVEILTPGATPAGDARADLDALMAAVFSADTPPEGWNGADDPNSVRTDLELLLLATAARRGQADLPGWFGPTFGGEWLIARANRHDLELLADATLGYNSRPQGWTSGEALVRCSRSTQNLVTLLQSEAGYTPGANTADPNFCRQTEVEASVFVESGATNVGTGGGGVTTSPGVIVTGGANVLRYGGVTQGIIDNATPSLSYTFSGYAGDAVTINMEAVAGGGGGNLDPFLQLLDQNGAVVTTDDNGGQGRNARLEATLPQTGLYSIVATHSPSQQGGVLGAFVLRLSGSGAFGSPPILIEGMGGGGAGESVTFVSGILGQATTPNAYLDSLARQRVGVMPRGTPFSALARNGTSGSRMMLVQGEGFVVWVAWPWTTLSEADFMSLPPADDLPPELLPPVICYAYWCSAVYLGGAQVSGVPAPGSGLQAVDNANLHILFNVDNVAENWAEFRLQLCAAPNSYAGCEPVLRLYESGQEVPPLRVENGYPVWRMTYYFHGTARLESAHYATDQLWVSHPTQDRTPP